MKNTVKIKYEVEDGYAGNNRPQYVEVSADDFAFCSDFNDVDELKQIIEDLVQDDFASKIEPTYDPDEALDAIKDLIEVLKEEEKDG